MTDIYAYEKEPFRRRQEVEVLVIGRQGDHLYAVLDDTLLFPAGGGQPADRGRLSGAAATSGEVRVVDVQRVEGEVRHYLSGDLQLGPATLEVDWNRRFDHMQQHSAQHVLTAVALGRFGWKTTAFHLRPEVCDIELDVAALDGAQLRDLEEAVMEEVRAARQITARRVSQDDLASLPLRSRGLPAGHHGDVRLIEIEGLDLNNCGGTHLQSTAQIECIKLLASDSLRGGARLTWIAGRRVRHRLQEAEARHLQLRHLLSTGDGELVAVTELKLQQLKDSERQLARRLAELAELRLADLLRQPGPWVTAHYDEVDMAFLQRLSRGFLGAAEGRCLFLTASPGDGDHAFLLAQGEGSDIDLEAVGRRVAELLGGRGGGRQPMFQGKAPSLRRRDEAVAVLSGGDIDGICHPLAGQKVG